MSLEYTVDRIAAMRIETSDDDGVTKKTILHEISFDFGIAREYAELASKDNANMVSPGQRTFTLSGTGYGDKKSSSSDLTQDLKDMLDWCKAGTTKQVDIAASDTTGDLTISSTDVFLQDVNFTNATNTVIEYTFTMKITNATFGTV